MIKVNTHLAHRNTDVSFNICRNPTIFGEEMTDELRWIAELKCHSRVTFDINTQQMIAHSTSAPAEVAARAHARCVRDVELKWIIPVKCSTKSVLAPVSVTTELSHLGKSKHHVLRHVCTAGNESSRNTISAWRLSCPAQANTIGCILHYANSTPCQHISVCVQMR